MTHRYTLLVGGTIISGRDEPDASAIAWAEDTVIALGTDEAIGGISRGDSHVINLEGATVVPLGSGPDACWPVDAKLEVGARADLAVLAHDPRGRGASDGRRLPAIALVRGGHVVAGVMPGGAGGSGHDPHDAGAGH
jgi:hypothetical protein